MTTTRLIHSSAWWASENPILELNQIGYDTDTGTQKRGDGLTVYNSLPVDDPYAEYTVVSGTDTYTASYTFKDILGYFPGLRIRAKFTNANTGAVATLNLNGIGAVDIIRASGAAISANDILGGAIYHLVFTGSKWQLMAPGGGSAGTVTSVALTVPSFLSVAGSPIISSGTFAVTLSTQIANTVFAGPTTGAPAAPTFRALIATDIPDLSGTYHQQGGNTYGATFVVGSNDAQAVSVETNNTERIRVLSTGQVLNGYAALASTESWGFQKNQNANSTLAISNTTSGTAGRAGITISNSATLATGLGLRSLSALYTNSGIFVADTAVIEASNAGGLNVGTSAATPLMFWSNSTERGRFLSSGEFLVGYTALAAVESWGFQKNQNANSVISITNTTSGTAGRAGIVVSNSATLATGLGLHSVSAGFTSSGILVANRAVVLSSTSGGLNIGTTPATSIYFYTTATQVAEIDPTGYWGIGTAAVAGAPITTTFLSNTALISRFINTSSGAAASSQVGARNNSNLDVLMGIRSSGFTTAGLVVANQGQFIGGAGLASMLYGTTAAGDSIFIRGGSAATDEVARFSSTGFQTANSKTIGINTAAVATRPITSSLSFNGSAFSGFTNTSNGTAALSAIGVINDAATPVRADMGVIGSGYITAGLLIANTTYYLNVNGVAAAVLYGSVNASDSIFIRGGSSVTDEKFRIGATNLTTPLNLKLTVAGNGIYVKEGANATMGRAVLVAGTVVVNTTKVSATSEIFLTTNVAGGTLGAVYVSARVNGTSFTIKSLNVLDTSTISWIIIEPA